MVETAATTRPLLYEPRRPLRLANVQWKCLPGGAVNLGSMTSADALRQGYADLQLPNVESAAAGTTNTMPWSSAVRAAMHAANPKLRIVGYMNMGLVQSFLQGAGAAWEVGKGGTVINATAFALAGNLLTVT